MTVSEQIFDLLDKLASSLGVAVSELYAVMIQQCRAQIVKNIFSIFVCLAVLALCGVYVYVFFVKRSGEYDETLLKQSEDDIGILAHIFLALGVAVLICIMFYLMIGYIREIIQCRLNPEYWAIKEIISMI